MTTTKKKTVTEATDEQGAYTLEVHIGKKLRQRRLIRDLTQTELGDMVNVTYQQMQKYERGLNRITASKLYEFSLALGVPISYFFEDAPAVEITRQGFGETSQETLETMGWEGENYEKSEKRDLLFYYFSIDDSKKRKNILDLVRGMTEGKE